jgi:hypothetical protein
MDGGAMSDDPDLRGRWKRSAVDSDDPLPAGIEFREGTYLAEKGHGQRFLHWDAGTYELRVEPDDPGKGLLTISTATDSLETYPVSFIGGVLEVAMEGGRRVRFDRVD